MSKILEKAREYENRTACRIPESHRPVFHFSAPAGWLNDPNGFGDFMGEHHLFFQYNPYDVHWDAMHWGHAKSRDFIKWEYLPTALAPDEAYDQKGVFSGGAVEKDGKHYLLYTGVKEITDEAGKKAIRQEQCLAEGDGLNYQKVSCNPVITAELLPKGSSLEDFRDPKLWEEDGRFYTAVGSRHADGSGQILLLSSEDLHKWKFCTVLARCQNQYGKMWECPDFFSLEGKRILIVSPQDMQAKDLEFHNGNGNIFLIGDYDKDSMDYRWDKVQSCDYGLDFYAAQTMETGDGRRIMIGWMQSWDNHLFKQELGWSGQFTVPRELFVRDGRVCQRPVRELENYRVGPVKHSHVRLGEELEALPGIEGRCVDMTVEIEAGDSDAVEIRLAENEDFYSSVLYNPRENTVAFDRTYSGFCRDFISSRTMKVRDRGGKLFLRILLDRYSCEIFANDGEQAMTSLLFSSQECSGIRFRSKGKADISVSKYEIAVVR